MSSHNSNERDPQVKQQLEGYPSLEAHVEKVLIVVKTYPSLSQKYKEVVCTAGITENGKLIRLYPIDYRYMGSSRKYKKYQWIEVEIEEHTRDRRIDSYRPTVKTIQPLGESLPAGKWKARKEIVLPLISKNLEEIDIQRQKHGISLGIFKPKEISFKIEAAKPDWTPRQQMLLRQKTLFGPETKELEKIPFKFSYSFTCNNSKCRSHKLVIVDWEIGELYRNMKEKFRYDQDLILEKVRNKFETQMWAPDRDSYLIVGTQFRFSTFLVLGVFWPPKQ